MAVEAHPPTMSDLDRLRAEARERWGDRWTIKTTEWADGTTRHRAIRSRGRVEVDGESLIEQDELKFTTDGELVVERVRVEPGERHSCGIVDDADDDKRA